MQYFLIIFLPGLSPGVVMPSYTYMGACEGLYIFPLRYLKSFSISHNIAGDLFTMMGTGYSHIDPSLYLDTFIHYSTSKCVELVCISPGFKPPFSQKEWQILRPVMSRSFCLRKPKFTFVVDVRPKSF